MNIELDSRELQLIEYALGKRIDAIHEKANKEELKKRPDTLLIEQQRLFAKEMGAVMHRIIEASP